MARLIALLVVLTGLTFVASPAQAAVSVTIAASRTVLMQGDSVTLRGKAVKAKPGSAVKLQRKATGLWRTVDSKKVRSTRRYAFTTQPRRGYQHYRVLKPRQLGQRAATSSVVRLTVRWQPTLTSSAKAIYLADGQQALRLTGRVTNGPSAPYVQFLHRPQGGVWQLEKILRPASGETFIVDGTLDEGTEYRLALQPSALTVGASSQTFIHAYLPYRLELNSGVGLLDVKGVPHAATVTIEIEQGQEVALTGTATGTADWYATVFSPAGQSLGHFRGRCNCIDTILRFTAPQTGVYTIDVEGGPASSSNFTMWASTPKTVPAVVDGATVVAASDFPGQIVDVEFDVSTGQSFTVNNGFGSGGPAEVLVAPDGIEQAAWLPELHRYHEGIYRADEPGAYRYRFTPRLGGVSEEVYVVSAALLEGVIDAPDINLIATVDVPGRVVLISFDPAPGESATVSNDGDWNPTRAETFDADTGAIVTRELLEVGAYVVAVSARDFGTGSVNVQLASPLELTEVAAVGGPAVVVDTSSHFVRMIHLGFTAEAGQVITLDEFETSGRWGGSTVVGPDGQTVPYLWGARTAWRLPVSGEYELRSMTSRLIGSIALAEVDQVAIPADGTPTTITLDDPGELVFARIPVAAGTDIAVTLDQVDASLGYTWDVSVHAPDGHWYTSFARTGTLYFTAREPGDVYVLVGTVSGTALGSVTLRAAAP